jgi:hypothetical protein
VEDDDITPWAIAITALVLALVLAICTWRALDEINSPMVTTTSTSIAPSTPRP